MNKLLLSLVFSMALVSASSQKVYFVYLQTDAGQPFFVKMNEKVYSSTASGYLILSKLHDSSYNFSVGFPQNKWPEQKFSVVVNKKDHGYLLKNFGEKGWGLFDLQTLAIQMSSAAIIKTDAVAQTGKQNVSVFTDILAKAADDPSLKEKPVQPMIEEKKPELAVQPVEKKEEPKAAPKEVQVIEIAEQPVEKKEEPKAEVNAEVKEVSVTKPAEIIEQPVEKKEEPNVEVKEQPIIPTEEIKIIPAEEYKQSMVTKKSESSTTGGFGLVFIDDYQNGVRDTISLIIPNPKPVVNPVKEEPKEEKKFLEISAEVPKKEEENTSEVKQAANELSVVKPVIKNNCSDMAAESDFLKLRKKMAAAESDDMVNEARRYFKTKCFTTIQVKNLGTLFLTDSGKYQFFEAAYTGVSDSENFSSLQAELKDEYYINRFKAMLK